MTVGSEGRKGRGRERSKSKQMKILRYRKKERISVRKKGRKMREKLRAGMENRKT